VIVLEFYWWVWVGFQLKSNKNNSQPLVADAGVKINFTNQKIDDLYAELSLSKVITTTREP